MCTLETISKIIRYRVNFFRKTLLNTTGYTRCLALLCCFRNLFIYHSSNKVISKVLCGGDEILKILASFKLNCCIGTIANHCGWALLTIISGNKKLYADWPGCCCQYHYLFDPMATSSVRATLLFSVSSYDLLLPRGTLQK